MRMLPTPVPMKVKEVNVATSVGDKPHSHLQINLVMKMSTFRRLDTRNYRKSSERTCNCMIIYQIRLLLELSGRLDEDRQPN